MLLFYFCEIKVDRTIINYFFLYFLFLFLLGWFLISYFFRNMYLTVKALEAINSTLKGLNWKINGNFCSEVRSFTKSSVSNVTCLNSTINGNFCSEVKSSTNSTVDDSFSSVTCNCSGTFCSITNMYGLGFSFSPNFPW